MTVEAIASITATTMLTVQLIKWGVPKIEGGASLATVSVVSLVFCVLYALSNEVPIAVSSAYLFVVAWVTVIAAAAGLYGFVAKPIQDSVNKDK